MFHRASIRCRLHDYAGPGWYFVTIVTDGRCPAFGDLEPPIVRLSGLGKVVAARWEQIARRTPFATPHDVIVMPDHLHGIVEVRVATRTADSPGAPRRFGPLQVNSLGTVINILKGDITQEAWRTGIVPHGKRIWQRGYHDRIIRGRRHLAQVRAYIRDNPIRAMSTHL